MQWLKNLEIDEAEIKECEELEYVFDIYLTRIKISKWVYIIE